MASKVPTSLAAACKASVIESLGDIATGRFTCGGTLQVPTKVQLNYCNNTGGWNGATFPGLTDADLQQMLESSAVASFGRGKELVVDKDYRDAYALDPEKFTTSFHLSNTRILGEIRLVLVPDVLNIRAELYKMNIYKAPTGCFKAHVDTPRSGNMFGSLVVCLPSQFSGGALVTRHNGQQCVYDWSSRTDDQAQKIQWAALFSDVEHEILTVTDGCRVTLTYNLYHCDQLYPVPAVDVTTSPFYANLKSALENPHFLRFGGILGFACQHAYVFEEFNFCKNSLTWEQLVDQIHDPRVDKSTLVTKLKDKHGNIMNILTFHIIVGSIPLLIKSDACFNDIEIQGLTEAAKRVSCLQRVLKGSDRTVLLAAQSLGLRAEVKAVYDQDDGDFVCDRFRAFRENAYIDNDDSGWIEYLKVSGIEAIRNVTWCQKFKYWQPAIAALMYGNDYSIDTRYQAAAILVTIPSWSERSCDAPSAEVELVCDSKRNKTDEDVRDSSMDQSS